MKKKMNFENFDLENAHRYPSKAARIATAKGIHAWGLLIKEAKRKKR